MSRDAKVGLVIVFAFVFLLGTILVHRFHLTDLGQLTGGSGTTAVDANASPAIGVSTSEDNTFGATDSGTVTMVDALPEENLSPPQGSGRTSVPFDSSFPGSRRLTGQPSSTRPPVDVPDSSDSGAHISLTDPRDDRQSAAVVESGGTPKNSRTRQAITEQSPETEIPETRPDLHRRSPPLVEISKGTSGSGGAARDMPNSETEVPSTAGDVSSVGSKEPAPDLSAEVTGATESDPESIADAQPGRSIPPLNRPPSLKRDDHAEMDTGSTSIQQAVDKRRQEREDAAPPRLPKYGEPPQATIESVPDRESRSAPRAADRSSNAADPFSPPNRTPRSSQSDDTQVAGQKTYVVKDGDSFWSISAKQYGTGKYYRALEEYNKDRLSASGNGAKVLRPGIVLALPDESLLQSNGAKKRPAEPAASKASKYDSWKEDSSIDDPARRDAASAPKREAVSRPGTYRVKEGDTLSTIAQRELGTSKRWQEIFQLNRDKLSDETSLKVGMELKMPSASTAEKAAGRPNF